MKDMVNFRQIDASGYAVEAPQPIAGRPPELRWIEVSRLVISPAYQRDIARRGAKNICKIAKSFDWSKFGTVVVAAVDDGRFAIVDGQHRATAAAARGLTTVPCQVIEADPQQQAAAFAAINGSTTAITPLALHAAMVAAGDERALDLDRVCAGAGVLICRYPVPASNMKPGETLAIGALDKAFKEFGSDVLALALRAIMASRSPCGQVRAAVITAICNVLDSEPGWVKNPDSVVDVFRNVDLGEMLDRCAAEAKRKKVPAAKQMAGEVYALLDDAVGG